MDGTAGGEPQDVAAHETASGRIDRILGLLIEIPAAAIVVVEMCLLLAGATSRYVFRHPLVWSDELASILFLWMAMLGAVIALRRNEHLRLTIVVRRTSPALRAWLETMALVVVVAFMLIVMLPSYHYVEDEAAITSPALEISDAWRVGALGVGVVLMLVIAIVQLVRRSTPGHLAGCIGALLAVGGLLWLAAPALHAMGQLNLLIFFVGIVGACLVIGVPIAFCFGIATAAFLAFTTSVPLTIIVNRLDEGMSGILLLSVPVFVFLGHLLDMSTMGRAMIGFLAALVGHVKAGLSYVLLGSMYLVSGISGSKVADMAAVAPALFPEMIRRGYKPPEMIAQLSTSAVMAETVPPSIVMIAVGAVTGVSIAGMFNAGLAVALVIAVILAGVARFRSRNEDMSGVARASPRTIIEALIVAFPALLLPFLIRGAVVEGFATATEVSAFAVVYALFAGALIYGGFRWRGLYEALVETAALSGAILLIVGTAHGMAWSLGQSGFAQKLSQAMLELPGGAAGFMAVTIVVFVALGCVLEGLPALVLLGPLMFPIAAKLGIHDIQYAMVVIIAMNVGLFAPPIGIGFYIACTIGRVSPDEALGAVWPYICALMAGLVLIAAVPWLSTFML